MIGGTDKPVFPNPLKFFIFFIFFGRSYVEQTLLNGYLINYHIFRSIVNKYKNFICP